MFVFLCRAKLVGSSLQFGLIPALSATPSPSHIGGYSSAGRLFDDEDANLHATWPGSCGLAVRDAFENLLDKTVGGEFRAWQLFAEVLCHEIANAGLFLLDPPVAGPSRAVQ